MVSLIWMVFKKRPIVSQLRQDVLFHNFRFPRILSQDIHLQNARSHSIDPVRYNTVKQVDVLQTLDVQSKNQGLCKLNYCKSIAIVMNTNQHHMNRHLSHSNMYKYNCSYILQCFNNKFLTVVQSRLSWNSYCEARPQHTFKTCIYIHSPL